MHNRTQQSKAVQSTVVYGNCYTRLQFGHADHYLWLPRLFHYWEPEAVWYAYGKSLV